MELDPLAVISNRDAGSALDALRQAWTRYELLYRSEGSEANDVIDAFTSLARGDQDAVIKFLLTLRLPLDPRYDFDDYR
jgi:hypothetical protein